ncbi:MAG: pyridoxal phosphate-dependent aminotransferase [Oscillospiraceae bacterium]|nr:pyridoxal phosphate-dependent aminotransferase [Oscillospiraceae bacterium]
MTYDFETLIDRSHAGSFKYTEMQMNYPDVPAGVVPFSMADMEFANAPEILRTLKQYLDTYTLGYCWQTEEYLNAVCSWQKKRHGWEPRGEWILPITGALPGLFGAIQEFSKPGEGVIYFSPVFGWFKGGAELNGRKAVPCSLRRDGDTFAIDFERLEELAADKNNRIVLLCNPHNPTGHIWSREDLARVADICMKHDLLLISDEVHADLVMPGYELTSMGAMGDPYRDNLIVCIAPSKTFNTAGMQAANLVIFRPDWKERMTRRLQSNGMFNLTALGYVTVRAAYEYGGEWLDQCIQYVWENHRALKAFAAEHLPGVKVFDLQATYLQWMDFSAVVKDHEELKEKLHKAWVIMDQGPDFGPEGNCFERMNLACPRRVLMAALERLAEVLYE